MSDAQFIIIGSGPAHSRGAMAAGGAGHRVLMLDGTDGKEPAPQPPGGQGLFEGLAPEDKLSPKLRTPLARHALSRFAETNRISGENFVAIGSLVRGGLSRVWGGFATEFAERDFAGWPITRNDLAPSYKRITERIGISGTHADAVGAELGTCGALQPPLPLGKASAALLRRYRSDNNALRLGLARNAVLSAPLDGRPACDLRNACLWGCSIGAIYDSRQDLARLAQHANFRLVDCAPVLSVSKEEDCWQACTADGRRFSAPGLLLAAGTLGSSRLVAPLLPAIQDWAVLSNPVMAAPMLVAAGLMAKPQPSHSLAQLAFFLSLKGGEEVSGAVYEIAGLPPSAFVNRLPLGRRAGAALFRLLAPGLMVAVTYFPGSYSRNRIHIDSAGSLKIIGGFDGALDRLATETARRLRQSWRAMGAIPLPGAEMAVPGTDAHLAGTLAMGARTRMGTSTLGELAGQPGLHIVDGAILPSLPSRHVTFTIMANADRIGSELARRPH